MTWACSSAKKWFYNAIMLYNETVIGGNATPIYGAIMSYDHGYTNL